MAEKYVDVLVEHDGIALDAFGFPVLINGRASIAQDLKHMIRESGLLVAMVGERNEEKIQSLCIQLENLVEDDTRIVPGTAKVLREGTEQILITAKTVEFGSVELSL